jgi:hypothetical protein
MYTERTNTGMYAGTVISDLMAVVERAERRAEQRAEQQRITEELQAIFSLESFSMQIPVEEHDPILIGAA